MCVCVCVKTEQKTGGKIKENYQLFDRKKNLGGGQPRCGQELKRNKNV